jgi:hypothetical protein
MTCVFVKEINLENYLNCHIIGYNMEECSTKTISNDLKTWFTIGLRWLAKRLIWAGKLLIISSIMSVGVYSIIYLLAEYLIQFSIIMQKRYSMLNIDTNVVTFSSSIITLFVTGIYVLYTAKIADETAKSSKRMEESTRDNRKDRKIAYIEKQLEKLYYPLKDYTQSSDIQSLKLSQVFYTNHFHSIEDSKLTLSDIIPYTHLASPKMKTALEDLSHFMRDFRESPDEYVEQKHTIEKINNINKLIDEDIQELKGQLDELYNSA